MRPLLYCFNLTALIFERCLIKVLAKINKTYSSKHLTKMLLLTGRFQISKKKLANKSSRNTVAKSLMLLNC